MGWEIIAISGQLFGHKNVLAKHKKSIAILREPQIMILIKRLAYRNIPV